MAISPEQQRVAELSGGYLGTFIARESLIATDLVSVRGDFAIRAVASEGFDGYVKKNYYMGERVDVYVLNPDHPLGMTRKMPWIGSPCVVCGKEWDVSIAEREKRTVTNYCFDHAPRIGEVGPS